MGDETRTYLLRIADSYDGRTPVPVVFVFHGDGGDGALVRNGVGDLEDRGGAEATFVYPDGPGKTWDTYTTPAFNADYQLIDVILDDVASTHCIDRKRVFAWGVSRGAFFVNHLGCYRGNVLRGVIAQSGSGPQSEDPADYDATGFFRCPTSPVAALIIHGDMDKIVPISGARYSRDHWLVANGCRGATTTSANPGPCVTYDGCARTVEWCEIGDFAHGVWPRMAEATWNFVSSFSP